MGDEVCEEKRKHFEHDKLCHFLCTRDGYVLPSLIPHLAFPDSEDCLLGG